MTKLGFIGTGHLAGFFVEGLKRVNAEYEIMVSPRNAEKAKDLRQRFGVTIAENQDIVDACDLVVVSLLPPAASQVLEGLEFRPGQTVLSVMAGVSLQTMIELASPADVAISMMTGRGNSFAAGPSVLHPDNPAAYELLSKLGPVHVYEDGKTFAAASVMGAFSGMIVLLMQDAVEWFTSKGLAMPDARALVAEVLKGDATVLTESSLDIAEIARGDVTPGGITEQGRKILDGGGSWPKALESVYQRVSTRY